MVRFAESYWRDVNVAVGSKLSGCLFRFFMQRRVGTPTPLPYSRRISKILFLGGLKGGTSILMAQSN
jgi:hypothetical protein